MEVLAAGSVLDGDAMTNAPVAEALPMHDAFRVEDAFVVDRLYLAGRRWGVGDDSGALAPYVRIGACWQDISRLCFRVRRRTWMPRSMSRMALTYVDNPVSVDT